DRNLVRPGKQELADIFHRPYAAANSERHKTMFSNIRNRIVKNGTAVRRSGNIQKTKFVRALRIVKLRLFDRISGIPQFGKIDAFHDTAVLYVKTRNDAGFKHRGQHKSGKKSF